MKIWQKRTSAPTKQDKYYVAKDEGGYNGFTKGYNMFNANGNCTSYCYGRFLEIGSNKAKGIIKTSCQLPTNRNAEDWFSSCTAYERGQKPAHGAVACFSKGKHWTPSDGCGHVAIVEAWDSKYIYCTESGYRHYLWRSCRYPIKNGKPYIAGYNFDGYIYNPWADSNWRDTNPYKEPTTTINRAKYEYGKIKVGNEGVKWIQYILQQHGYYADKIDGFFGPKTEAAVKEFQKNNKDINGKQLEVDGSVGPLTRGALKK